MKKIIIISIMIILIPFLIVTIFIKEDEIKFQFVSNMVVRVKRENGQIDKVPFEEYVKGVLAGEMPTSFEMEALKAQAVAARSYVMKKMKDNYQEAYDVVDTVMNQVYLDDETLKQKWGNSYTEKNNKIKQAILQTKGEYMTYNSEVIEAFFFSTSTGKTENSGEIFQQQLPYLKSVDSSWDAEVSPVFQEKYQFSLREFYQKLNLEYKSQLQINTTKTTSTGRIKELTINEKSFTGNEIYQKLNLRSTFFQIHQQGENVEITTKGYGHGVGMSQYGALAMAKKGYQYQEILKYYYQGIEIQKL